MKTQNKQKKWRKWVSKVLLLTLLATMVPTYEAKAVDVKATGKTMLGNAEWIEGESNKLSFPNVNVAISNPITSDSIIHTVIVSVTPNKWGEGSIAGSHETPTITDVTDNGMHTAVWIFSSGKSVSYINKLLSEVTFDYGDSMVIKVTVDSNPVDVDKDSYLTEKDGHYYMYVPYAAGDDVSWTAAYNSAKKNEFMGMRGYLATISTKEEAEVLRNISSDAGWTGGTLLVNDPEGDDYVKIKDPTNIVKSKLSIYTGTGAYGKPNMTDAATDVYTRLNKVTGNRVLYYWACGPDTEAGNPIDVPADPTQTIWADNEPDCYTNGPRNDDPKQVCETCVIANYQNTTGLKDIFEENSEGIAKGYFVEFGGYSDDETYKNRLSETKEVEVAEVIHNINNGTFEGISAPQVDKTYSATIVPNEDYELPDTISVRVNDQALIAGEGYVWSSGTVKIFGENVRGTIRISAECSKIATVYGVTYKLNGAETAGASTIKAGVNFSTVIKAKNGYVLPGNITVEADGEELKAGTAYSWDASTGKLTIKNKYITGNITIKVDCVETGNVYNVTIEVEDGTCDGADTAKSGENYTATIKAKTRYKLPDSITVRVGGTKLKEGTGYKWDDEAGKITIYGKVINADVTIGAECPKKGAYSVTHSISGGTYTGSANIEEGTAYSSTIKADEGYTLPNAITVTVGGDELKEGIDYTWSATGGKVSIPAESVTGNIEITAGCTLKAATYTVSCTVNNGTCTDAGSANSGKDYVLTITANTGYRLTDAILVKAGNKELVAGTDYTWDKATGKLTIKGSAVTGNITITVDCVAGEEQSTSGTSDTSGSSNSGDKPQTGDNSNLLLYVLIMTLGVGGVVGSIVYKTLKEY